MRLPDIKFSERNFGGWKPSWSGYGEYLSALHKDIWHNTNQIEGWQAEGDSLKLFEMAYFCGDVILEVGTFGGKSAVIELTGAMSNPKRSKAPQYIGIDKAPDSILRTRKTLVDSNFDQYAFLLHGELVQYARTLPFQPTMVFLDGDHSYEGVKVDLAVLSHLLPAGIPVLCHDYRNSDNDTGVMGVKRACHEWEFEGYAEFMGTFGASAFYVTTSKCLGQSLPLSIELLRSLRENLYQVYDQTLKGVRVRPFSECQ